MTHDVVAPLRTERISLSDQAQHYLLTLIENGTYPPGEQLPSEKSLATQLGISRPTLREALHILEQDGIVVRRHGVGTFVASSYNHRLESGLERLESILELAARQGLTMQCSDLEVNEEPATARLAEKLGVSRGAPLLRIARALGTDTQTVAYMVDYASTAYLSAEDVDHTFRGSVLDLLRRKQDLEVLQAEADITALTADADLAKKLRVKKGQPILLMEELLFDQRGQAIEFSRNYFVPEHFRFRVVRR
jgi:GntR family transcriptional regulator